MSGVLRAWLSLRLEEEVSMALEFWETNDLQRTAIQSSQQLEAMFEDDGSNLRIQVQISLGKHAYVQIVKFTQTEEDEPIDAIVSDGFTSVKVRFSHQVVKHFENKHKRSITHQTTGGIMNLRNFEIIVPQFGSADDDSIFLLAISAEYIGSGNGPIFGKPTPVYGQPKMKKLLRRFHKIPSDGESGGGGSENDGDVDYDLEILSQGAPEPETTTCSVSQNQFGTQFPLSQAPLPKQSAGARNDVKVDSTQKGQENKIQQTDNRRSPHDKSANQQQLLALLDAGRGSVKAAKQVPMPPPVLPQVSKSGSCDVQASKPTQTNPEEPLRSYDEGESRGDDKKSFQTSNFSDDDMPMLHGGDDDHVDSAREADTKEFKKLRNAPVENQEINARIVDVPAPDDAPTSYQPPLPSTSTNPSIMSSIPSVVQTVEKDHPQQIPSKQNPPLLYYGPWKCLLPVTRSVSQISPEQSSILNKPTSILPPDIHHRFPIGNVPTDVLQTITAKLEERTRKNTSANTANIADNISSLVIESKTSPERGDQGNSDALSIAPPEPTMEIPWSSSPVRPVTRMADLEELPPDSSLPDKQSLNNASKHEHEREEHGTRKSFGPAEDILETPTQPQHANDQSGFIVGETEDVFRRSPALASSPPRVSPEPMDHGDFMNEDESDLETAVPKAYTQMETISPKAQSPTVASPSAAKIQPRKDPNSQLPNFMTRHVSSSGAKYTHLHLPPSVRQWEVTTSCSPGTARAIAQQSRSSQPVDTATSSSAPVIPCSWEAPRPSQPDSPQKVGGLDGAAESKMSRRPEHEDALVEHQIYNEIQSQSSRRRSVASTSARDQVPASSPLGHNENPLGTRASPTERHSTTLRRNRNAPTKREAVSPSSPDEARKRPKQSHSRYHFSQDAPLSQDPMLRMRAKRREFMANIKLEQEHEEEERNDSSHSRGSSGSFVSSSRPSGAQRDPTPVFLRTDLTKQIKAEPDQNHDSDPSTHSEKLSNKSSGKVTSSGDKANASQASPRAKIKTEATEDDDVLFLPVEAIDNAQPAHDGMDVDTSSPVQSTLPQDASVPTFGNSNSASNATQSIVEEARIGEQALPEASAKVKDLENSPRSQANRPNEDSAALLDPQAARIPGEKRKRLLKQEKKPLANLKKRCRKRIREEESRLRKREKRREKRKSVELAKAQALQETGQAAPSHDIEMVDISAYEDDSEDLSDGSSILHQRADKRASAASLSDSDDSDDSSISGSSLHSEASKRGIGSSKKTGEPSIHHTRPSDSTPITMAQTEAAAKNSGRESLRDEAQKKPAQVNSIGTPTHPPSSGLQEFTEATKPDDVFTRFRSAYSEYTGDRKHFDNLCGQIDWLRQQKRMLHPFLWDDYVIRSRIEYKEYTEKCTNEGVDPLPWYQYYVEAIPTPKFNKGIMTPTTLQKTFKEQGKPVRHIVHENVQRVQNPTSRGPPQSRPTSPPRMISRGDTYRPNYFKQPQLPDGNAAPSGSRGPQKPQRHPQRVVHSLPPKPLASPRPVQTQPQQASSATSGAIRKAVPSATSGKALGADAPKLADQRKPALKKTAPLSANKKQNGTPAPSSSAVSTKSKSREKSMFTIFKERYNKPRPGNDRAGSTA